MTSRKPVAIKTHNVGQAFGCSATVHANGKTIYETETYPFGMGNQAFAHAEEWADRNGHVTQRGLNALAAARAEYSYTVSAADAHPAPDARRVLTSEHCQLMSAIQKFEREQGFDALEAATAECKNTRQMWTQW